jgi:hypothetical protein
MRVLAVYNFGHRLLTFDPLIYVQLSFLNIGNSCQFSIGLFLTWSLNVRHVLQDLHLYVPLETDDDIARVRRALTIKGTQLQSIFQQTFFVVSKMSMTV